MFRHFFFLTWHWKCFQKENRKQNKQYFCSWCANNIFGTVIFLAFFFNYKSVFWLDKNGQLYKTKVWQPEAMFIELSKYAVEWRICKTAKTPNFASTVNNILPCTLPNITSNTGWKITSWIMHLENKWYCSSDVLVNISFIIQPATQILLVKCYNNNLVCFSSSDQSFLTTIIHKPKVGLPQNQITPSVD